MNSNKMVFQINREGFFIDKSGNLEFDRCELVKLAQKYGTPCYIFSENIIIKKCQQYTSALSKRNIDFEVIYAGKAFLVKAMCNILKEEGLSLDVSSGGELYTALSAGFPPEKIYFHGNNKSKEEIEFALKEASQILSILLPIPHLNLNLGYLFPRGLLSFSSVLPFL
ncbi:unnamed protein product [marine sediment metagenome]|uniref:Orn/DAP/Arg decarboxylase 2 N-terminal domain-containing protein n=1 Tax=marine sediment metagenome TaxID=412755 RepID=X1MYV7_9ZZZZ